VGNPFGGLRTARAPRPFWKMAIEGTRRTPIHVSQEGAAAPSTIKAIDVVRLADRQTVATFPVDRPLDQPGRYELRLRWH